MAFTLKRPWRSRFPILFTFLYITLTTALTLPPQAVGLLVPDPNDYTLDIPPGFNLTNYNANTRNTLPDPTTHHIPNTTTTLTLSQYGSRLSSANATAAISNATTHARHYPRTRPLAYYQVWYPYGNVALTLTPQPGAGMTYGMFVDVCRGLRWFVVGQGMNVEVRFEVFERFGGTGEVEVGKGSVGFWKRPPVGCRMGGGFCVVDRPGAAGANVAAE
ncbi:hypothetical protein ACLMJK_006109 [Lecanora helva]